MENNVSQQILVVSLLQQCIVKISIWGEYGSYIDAYFLESHSRKI